MNKNKKTNENLNKELNKKTKQKYKFIKVFNYVLINLFRLILIFMFIIAIIEKDDDQILLVALSFLASFYKELIKLLTKVKISDVMQTISTTFVILTILLGTLMDVYGKIIWWDTLLHFISGVFLSFFGLMFLAVMKNKNEKLKYSVGLIVIFSFLFSMTAGTIWEILEFIADNILGMNAQRAKGVDYGVLDTMIDTIANTVGAIIGNVSIFFYLRKKEEKEIYELLDDCFIVPSEN